MGSEETIKMSDLMRGYPADFFNKTPGLVLVCGGACTDWTWTINPADQKEIISWFEGKRYSSDSLGKLGDEVLKNGGEFPIYPHGLDLRDFMIQRFGEPSKVQHGSQGLNAGLQASAFGFSPVSYGHSISRENIDTLSRRSPVSLELMGGINYIIGDHSPSVTINIRIPREGFVANAYLSDARERYYNSRVVQDHLNSTGKRIEDVLCSGNSSGVLVADIQVLGHSISRELFADYLVDMNQVMSEVKNLRTQNSNKLTVLVDSGGLNFYDDNAVIGLFTSIYGKAPILGGNEYEIKRLARVMGCDADSSDKDSALFLVRSCEVGSVWLHTKDYQAFFSKRTDLDPVSVARTLAFSNLTAGRSLVRGEPVTLDYLASEITKGGFVKDSCSFSTSNGYLSVNVPATTDKPQNEIQAGDRAGIALIYASLAFKGMLKG